MKVKYLAFPLIFAIGACSLGNEAARITIEEKSYETDYSQVSVQLLQFEEIGTPEYTEALNQALAQESDEALAGFDADAELNKDEIRDGNKSIFETTQTVHYNKNEFVSVVEEQYTYTGGAHGMTVRKGRNFDVQNEKEITLADLFGDEGWRDALDNYLSALVADNPDRYSELWQHPKIKDEQDFYITDTDLVVFYQPYELSYYARGFVEFPLRLSEIQSFMKEEYYRLMPSDSRL